MKIKKNIAVLKPKLSKEYLISAKPTNSLNKS